LFQHGDPEATRRLQSDPAFRIDPRKLTLQLDDTDTRGFSLTVDQLLTHRTFWLPELDVFISAGEPPATFAATQLELAARRGCRLIDRIANEPEASYAQYTNRWEDMGHPAYQNPHSIAPGHIVGNGWDSALHKFAVDRLAGVRNDYSQIDRFDLSFDFGNAQPDLAAAWKSQRLTDGLPLLTTTFEKDGVRCEVEQFSYPLGGPPMERRGDMPMVLLQRVPKADLHSRRERESRIARKPWVEPKCPSRRIPFQRTPGPALRNPLGDLSFSPREKAGMRAGCDSPCSTVHGP